MRSSPVEERAGGADGEDGEGGGGGAGLPSTRLHHSKVPGEGGGEAGGEVVLTKDVNERYSQELMNMVMQKYQAAEVGTFNPNLPLPM